MKNKIEITFVDEVTLKVNIKDKLSPGVNEISVKSSILRDDDTSFDELTCGPSISELTTLELPNEK